MRAADTSTPSETIAAVNLNTATPKWNLTNSYSYSKPIYAAVSIPKAGNFVFEIWSKGNTAVALYKDLSDVGVNDPVDYTSIPAAQSEDDTYYFTPQVKEAGTYYLVFIGDSYTETYSDLTIGYIAANKSGGTTTLTSGKTATPLCPVPDTGILRLLRPVPDILPLSFLGETAELPQNTK